ncbi:MULTISPECIES: DNA-binding protein [unclassified Bacillus (in: firmicutes)]|uniref:DNA-binding protein n=1 Tax=unclassified Bacillus (in: firmicutes) TaxID=185979 RepID=UPI001BE7688A|nr:MULTISPECIES: DNA-binding protein [unclassified Bacillus (in: firmicutes)]MBT2615113.1 DNA-binding protein [Bacillus sp. ISL-78]MBT2628274.1 DNA-binding protein [Bacillus sp. ISL-101]
MFTFNSREELAEFVQKEIINTTEALDILQCSRQNLNDLVKRNVITPIKDLPRDRLFLKEDIVKRKDYMDKKREASS